MGCDLLVFAAHRQAGLVPFGKAIFETPRPKPSAPQFTHGVIGVYAVGASAVGDALADLLREIVDRSLTLREDIDDLRAAAARERACHFRERVEHGVLRDSITHSPPPLTRASSRRVARVRRDVITNEFVGDLLVDMMLVRVLSTESEQIWVIVAGQRDPTRTLDTSHR